VYGGTTRGLRASFNVIPQVGDWSREEGMGGSTDRLNNDRVPTLQFDMGKLQGQQNGL